jgi:hypothetical protein
MITPQTSGFFMQQETSPVISQPQKTESPSSGNLTLLSMKKLTSRTGHLLSRAEQLLERSFMISHPDNEINQKD